MTDNIKDVLKHRIDLWEGIGNPAIMERFVFRNGKVFTPKLVTGRRMRQGECFKNASLAADRGTFEGGVYVEGFGLRSGLGVMIHHGWIGVGDEAIDVTWGDPQNCQYIGVEVPEEERWPEQLRTGYYPILDNPSTMINIDFIFRRDPELKPIIEKIVGHKIDVNTEGEPA